MTTSALEYTHAAATSQRVPMFQDLTVSLALTPKDVRDSQRLRYRIFAEEMGARLHTPENGLDSDAFDPYCRHVIVRDRGTQEVVASTRVLLDAEARRAGGFYSASEFDIGKLRDAAGPMAEIGRTCVHPDYRSGSAISLLWSGLARFVDIHQYRYLIGCASVPMDDGGKTAMAIHELLKHKYLVPATERVTPLRRLPKGTQSDAGRCPSPALPPLLKAYIRLGARIGGEPCWEPDFGCADFLVVLSPAAVQRRYAKRFFAA